MSKLGKSLDIMRPFDRHLYQYYLATHSDFGAGQESTASTLVDSSKGWVTNMWTNFMLILLTGPGAGQARIITSNTAIALTLTSDWTRQPNQGDLYKICGANWAFESAAQPNLRVGIMSGATGPAAVSGLGDTQTFPVAGGLSVIAWPLTFNETNFDRERGNVNVTALASAARTASTNSADLVNYNGRGIHVYLDVTVNPGAAETLQLLIQAKDALSGGYYNLLSDGAQAYGGVAGSRQAIVYNGVAAASADVDAVAGFPVPRTYRVRIVHSAAGSWTYSVGASVIL